MFCLDGETIIKTTEGDFKLKDLENKEIKVYSLNNENQLVESDICTVTPTIKTNEEYEIELEDGSIIKCTPNHKFMLKDGTYKEAQYLTEDDELMDMNFDINIINKAHEAKCTKQKALDILYSIPKEVFKLYYNTHTVAETLAYYNINLETMRLIRKAFGITDFSQRKSSPRGRNKSKIYNNGINQIMVKIGEPIPEGFILGALKKSAETCKKISESKKGKPTIMKGKSVYIKPDGSHILLSAEEAQQLNYKKLESKNKGKKAYNNGKDVKYFFEGTEPEGWVLGDIFRENKVANAITAAKNNIKNFETANNCTQLKTLFKNSLHILRRGTQIYISNDDIPRIKERSSMTAKSTNMKRITEYEKLHNCTCTHHLIEKFGQLQILFQLPKIIDRHVTYIDNKYLTQIISYYKNSQKPISKPEKELVEYIKTIYTGEIKENVHTVIKNPKTNYPLELDIFIPEKKLAIEFDGIFWHSSFAGKDKHYHELKSKLCEKQGIRLIHIFQDEWHTKQEKLKQLLKIALGVVTNKIYARKCEIKHISNKEAKDFSNKTHLQGHRNASITYGLFYNNELVQLMSFSKTSNAKRNGAEWEIIRGCPGSNNIVIGGVSKLFKAFIKENSPKSVFSYCDFNKFNGKSYEELGMKFIGYTGPDKYWIINQQLVQRNPNKYTELKNKATNVLWGAGSKKYLWLNKETNL